MSPLTPTDAEPQIDAVSAAVQTVPPELFHGEDGQAVRPCTPPHVTMRHLRMLDVRPGMRVLEVGTGSGWSAALLTHLVGATGRLVTIEIDPKLARRARDLLAEYAPDAQAIHADGIPGHPDGAPYDRIMAGTTPDGIPTAWLHQLAPGGHLLAGVRIHDLPGSYAITHLTVDDSGTVTDCTVLAGGYTPAHTAHAAAPAGHANIGADTTADDETTPHGVALSEEQPPYGDDADDSPHLLRCTSGQATVVCATPGDHADAVAGAVDRLADLGHTAEAFSGDVVDVPAESFWDFRCWVMAGDAPTGTVVVDADAPVADGSPLAIGLLDPTGHVALRSENAWHITGPTSPAAAALAQLAASWHAAGQPAASDLKAVTHQVGDRTHIRLHRPG